MSSFHNTYEKIRKTLLSEQENQQVPEQPQDQSTAEPQMEPQIAENEPSELKNIEEDSINVDWIKKIIKLLTLLNREDDTVQNIISDLSGGEVNADSLKTKSDLIEDLLRTIPAEKNI
jgi:hypothetical protein